MEDEPFSSLSFGTPLRSLDEDDRNAQIRPKPIAIHDQIVTDEKGRRRFHGAFSGGFSAGYFNTVGSRDGWTPKHFKSSRSGKSESSNEISNVSSYKQSAEDFMDEEDVADFGIAPKKLQASSNFFQKFSAPKESKASLDSSDYFDKKNARLGQISDIFRGADQDSAIPCGQPVFEQIFVPAKETVGVRLLREMGWKPGQGIGPRVTKKSKKVLNKKNHILFLKGQAPKGESSDEDENNDEFLNKYRDFLFAPDDVPAALSQQAKENLFGIAYKGLDRTQSSSEHFSLFTQVSSMPSQEKGNARSTVSNKLSRSKPILGQAFGVGVYEEEDEDIYAKDDVSRYDFYLETSRSKEKDPKDKRTSRWEQSENSQCLAGFVPEKSASKLNKGSLFPPPQLPTNYKPNPIKKSRFDDNDDKKQTSLSKHSDITCKVPSTQRPATDNEHEKSNNLRKDTETKNNPGLSQKSDISSEELSKLVEEIQNQHHASSLLSSNPSISSTFKPYANDPPKQKRYEQYILCLKNGRRDALPLLQPKDMTEWERNREQTEFDRAAVLYHNSDNSLGKKSIASFMSSRFVSAKSNEELDVGKDLSSSKKNDTISLTEAEKAAKLKCYGKLTREKVEWHPARLLCIRFNVKQPYGDSSLIGAPPGYKCRLDIFRSVSEAKPEMDSTPHSNPQQSESINLNQPLTPGISESEESSKNHEDEEKFKKASNDLFKAIFLDSDDNSDSETEASKEDVQPTDSFSNASLNDESHKQSNIHQPEIAFDNTLQQSSSDTKCIEKGRNYKQPKGLFANIDFSSFKAKKAESNVQEIEKSVIGPSRKRPTAIDFIQEVDGSSDKSSSDESNAFGPKKPKKSNEYSNSETHNIENDLNESDEWIEDNSKERKERTGSQDKKKKSKKSKHKKDKKKKRSKHEYKELKRKSGSDRKKSKKSRKKYRYSSSDASATSSTD